MRTKCNALISIIFGCVILLCITPAKAQNPALKVQKIATDLYLLVGNGGNGAFLLSSEAVLVVDSKNDPTTAREIVQEVKKLTTAPVRYLVNTHYHGDHTHGNQVFSPLATIISHQNTRENIIKFDLPRNEESRTSRLPQMLREQEAKVAQLEAQNSPQLQEERQRLEELKRTAEELEQLRIIPPSLTFETQCTIYLDDYIVELIYMGAGHTNGDVVVYFPQQKVIHLGDLLFHQIIPYIDVAAGADTAHWIEILNQVKEMEVETIIPGHGELTDIAGLEEFINYLSDLRQEVKNFIDQGQTLEDTKENLRLPKYSHFSGYNSSLSRNVEAVYRELTRGN
ncbi:MAG: MBL fold metallo-hydrolase [Candidatus Aminicenantes bacterium]|nr:MBL fold metallo-hydrolase [Candidatus Aminicenantes bacterium]